MRSTFGLNPRERGLRSPWSAIVTWTVVVVAAAPAATVTAQAPDTGAAPAPAATAAPQAPASAAPASTAPASSAPTSTTVQAPAAPTSAAAALAAEADTGEPQADEAQTDEPQSSLDLLPLLPPGQGGLTAAEVASRSVEVSGRARKASAQAENAERKADRAFSLFVPRVNLTARYTRLSDIDLSNSPLQNFGGNFPIYFPNNYLFKASIRVPVSEYFMTLREHYASAQKMETVAMLQKQGEHQAVAHDGMREYYALARALAAKRLSQHRVQQLEHFVEEIRVLVEGGEVSQVELAQAQARLAGAQALAERDLATLHVSEQMLRVRIGADLTKPIGIAEPLTANRPEIPSDLGGLLKTADATRPELVALRELIVAHRHTRDASEAARYPSLALFGDVDLANPNQRYFPLNNEFRTTWSAGVELTWSPTDLAVRQNELDDSELQVVSAEGDLTDLRARVALEVTTAYEQAVAMSAAVTTSEIAVASAEETLRIRMALFHGGEATSREVLDAEVDLRVAQLNWLDNVLSAHLAQADLLHATGQLKF